MQVLLAVATRILLSNLDAKEADSMDLQKALDVLARVGAGETFSLSDLTSARDVIARQLHSLRGSASPDLDALTTLRESYFAMDAAVQEATEREASTTAEVDAALSDIPDPDEGEDDEDEEEDAGDDTEASTSPKKGKMLSVQEAVARLGLTPSTVQVTEPEKNLSATETRVIMNGDIRDGQLTIFDVAEAFRDASSRSLKAGKERVVRVETTFDTERTLTGKVGADTRLVDSFMSPEAVTAAGGCCSLPEPIYSNPVAGSTARPIRSSLGTMGAARGKFTFFPAICLPVDGVGMWSCEDDELVNEADPTTWKSCVEVDCDEVDEVGVDAIYSCVTVGNYQARFAPEQWQGYLTALAVMNARQAETALFGKMRSSVIATHTADALGSIFNNLINGVALTAAAMRQDQRLSELQFNLWLPEWVKTAIHLDLLNRRVFSSAVDDPNATEAMLNTAFSNEGINAIWSPDIDPITVAGSVPVDGPPPALPATAGAVLAPDGFFTFLDGGTLDLGTEIRDHNLNRQNKVAAFAESYEGLLARGCDARGIDIPVEVCDNVACPEPAAPAV